MATETGEQGEEIVEDAVPSAALEVHEEWAELLLSAAGGTVVLMSLGLLPGRAGAAARIGGVGLSLIAAGIGWQAGHTGGELVYRHGAAAQYVNAVQADSGNQPAILAPDEDEDD